MADDVGLQTFTCTVRCVGLGEVVEETGGGPSLMKPLSVISFVKYRALALGVRGRFGSVKST